MPLIEERIRRPAECCPCDECGRPMQVGDTVSVDLEGGAVYCSARCAERIGFEQQYDAAANRRILARKEGER